jgi:hypothetical protein
MQTFAIYHLPLHNRKPGVDSEFEQDLSLTFRCTSSAALPRQAASALAALTKEMRSPIRCRPSVGRILEHVLAVSGGFSKRIDKG